MNQAMGVEPTFDIETKITETVSAIVELEKKATFAKQFKRLYENEDFQKVIIDTLLGSEMRIKAESLVDPKMNEELEQETLIVLRSLRYLNKFISAKLHEAEIADLVLAQNRKYLLALQANKEDI